MYNFTKRVITKEGTFDVSFAEAPFTFHKRFVVTIAEDDYTAPSFEIEMQRGNGK